MGLVSPEVRARHLDCGVVMIAPLVTVAFYLHWWPNILAVLEKFGAAIEEVHDHEGSSELVIYTGRNLQGAWSV